MSAVRGPQPAANKAMPAPEPALASAPRDSFASLRENLSQPVIAAFCAGGVAGAVSRTVVSPLERLKILMQVQSAGREAYKLSVGQALAKMWREEGWRGFMRGNGTNCIRIVPYSAVQFSSYNFYKRVKRRHPTARTEGESPLTLPPEYLRLPSRCRAGSRHPPHLRRRRRHHLRLPHLPARHCPHAPVDPVGQLCRVGQQASAAARHVGHPGAHVQD